MNEVAQDPYRRSVAEAQFYGNERDALLGIANLLAAIISCSVYFLRTSAGLGEPLNPLRSSYKSSPPPPRTLITSGVQTRAPSASIAENNDVYGMIVPRTKSIAFAKHITGRQVGTVHPTPTLIIITTQKTAPAPMGQPHGSAFFFLPCLASPLVRQLEYVCSSDRQTYFVLDVAVHLLQAIRYKLRFMIPTMVAGGIGELIGWSGRYWSSQNPDSFQGFFMQITSCLISYARHDILLRARALTTLL